MHLRMLKLVRPMSEIQTGVLLLRRGGWMHTSGVFFAVSLTIEVVSALLGK